MQIAVIHNNSSEASKTVAFIEVGNIDVIGVEQALEYAYMRTQNIHGSWSKPETIIWSGQVMQNSDYHKDITVLSDLPRNNDGFEIGIRSTMTGDHMLVGNKKYVVDMVGFKELEEV